MAGADPFSIALLSITAATTVAGVQQQRRATAESRSARRAQQRQASLQNARQRAEAIAAERRQRAAVIAQTEAAGASGSSSAVGAIGSLRSNLAGNLSFANQIEQLENQKQAHLNAAGAAQSRAATFGALAQLPGQFGFDPASTMRNMFNQPQAQAGMAMYSGMTNSFA